MKGSRQFYFIAKLSSLFSVFILPNSSFLISPGRSPTATSMPNSYLILHNSSFLIRMNYDLKSMKYSRHSCFIAKLSSLFSVFILPNLKDEVRIMKYERLTNVSASLLNLCPFPIFVWRYF